MIRPLDEPDDVSAQVPDDHPQTDTNVDAHEKYDEGQDGVVEQMVGPKEPNDNLPA